MSRCPCPLPDGVEEGEYWDPCDIHAQCDDKCGALLNPTTLDEALYALEHARNHSWLSGCSHAC